MMKKNIIAILLSVVLATGSLGSVPVLAAESTAEEAVPVQEESVEEQEKFEQAEEADSGLTVENASEEEASEAVEEEPDQNTEVTDEDDASLEEVDESANTAETAEVDEEDEEEITEPSDEGTTSTEIAEIEEPLVIEEEITIEETKDAAMATSGKCGANATWSISGTTLTISGSGAMTDYGHRIYPYYSIASAPSDFDEFGNYCDERAGFYFTNDGPSNKPWLGKGITKVIIKDGITSIGTGAFNGCTSITSVTIPNSVKTIGAGAFSYCGLKNITIPSNVKNIGDYAFCGCNDLTSITIPNGVTSINYGTFVYCTKMTNISIPNSVKTIGNYAFFSCSNLSSIALPSSVTSIGSGAFLNCTGLKSAVIPNSVTSIKNDTFRNCSGLTSITIPNSVTNIGYGAFFDCSSLAGVTIPNSITSIGSVFVNCRNITSITIPNSVTSISDHAFHNCRITNITIPNSVRSIECQAFRGCGAINIRFLGTKKQWNSIVGLWEEDDGSYVIIGDNVYTASITFSVDIGTFSVDADFTLPHQAYYYTGEPILGEVIVSYGGDVLAEGTDYELQYENNTDIGTATVYVNGIGDYSGTAQLAFRIRLGSTVKVTCKNLADGMKVSWEKVTGAKRYHVYRDNILIADVSALLVLDREVKLNSGEKYTYKVVAVDSKGVESDVYRTGTYYRLLPTGIKTLTSPSAGKMTVTYDKSPGSSGYVVQFSTKSDMSDAKVISVQGADTLSRTFTNLAKGKTYYVQVRTYKIDNGVRYYSGYCRTKTVTIKK